ncbi:MULTISPECIES: glycosyltransferase family 4 protein [unclassified Mesorhizobium]|uniref:glycosyltransferase family 4 protein n=1 Tax=unclassified Mesorhizobium TaxID=325217 RepID=UPI003339ABF1
MPKSGSWTLRWCFVSPGYRSTQVLAGDSRSSGGAEAQIAHLAAALAGLGHEVSLIYGDGQTQSLSKIAGVSCIAAAPAWRLPASLPAFWRAMDTLRPDVLYARLPTDFIWLMGLFARSRRDTRFIYALANDVHCTAWTAYDHKKWFHAPLFSLGMRSTDVIAVQHHQQSAMLNPRLRERSAHVPNLVRSVSEHPRVYDTATIDAIWIAKIRTSKQLHLFLDLAEALPRLRFAVVGGFDPTVSSTVKVALEERIRRLKNLTFYGPKRDNEVMALLSKANALVNTSSVEGFPNTMLEAWSIGVPVVSLSVDPGGVIEQKGIGFVSRTMTQLVHDVDTIVRTKSLNQRCGELALSYVRRQHSLEAVCRALERALPGVQLGRCRTWNVATPSLDRS